MNSTSKRINILVVDDSALVRQAMVEILRENPEIGEINTANDPYMAAAKLRESVPHVMILDVEMPRMDGLTFLKKIMTQHPIPVVICSSLAGKDAETTFKALEYGAVHVIEKPKLGSAHFIRESAERIGEILLAAASINRASLGIRKMPSPKLDADVILSKRGSALPETTEKVVVVGSSMGGTEALRVFLSAFHENAPGMVVVQHMPGAFTRSFAERLDQHSRLTVREATHGDSVIPGHVLIAPGNLHLLLQRSGARYRVMLKDGPLVSRHRPAVDVLFRSAARYAGSNAVGVILTGMGDDGAKGIYELKQAGAATIAQDEATSLIYGMPKAAVQTGAVDYQLPLDRIPNKIMQLCAT